MAQYCDVFVLYRFGVVFCKFQYFCFCLSDVVVGIEYDVVFFWQQVVIIVGLVGRSCYIGQCDGFELFDEGWDLYIFFKEVVGSMQGKFFSVIVIGDEAYVYFYQADVGFCGSQGGIVVYDGFVIFVEDVVLCGCYYRYGGVLVVYCCLLEEVDGYVQFVEFLLIGQYGDYYQVGVYGEMLGVVVNDQAFLVIFFGNLDGFVYVVEYVFFYGVVGVDEFQVKNVVVDVVQDDFVVFYYWCVVVVVVEDDKFFSVWYDFVFFGFEVIVFFNVIFMFVELCMAGSDYVFYLGCNFFFLFFCQLDIFFNVNDVLVFEWANVLGVIGFYSIIDVVEVI